MKKILKIILSFIIITIFITIVSGVSLYLSYKTYLDTKYVPDNIKMIVEDEIKVYLKQDYQLTPHLINSDKEIEEGQYRYESNSPEISISDNGCITISKMPEKECIITIYEINHNISKDIKIKVINEISYLYKINPLFEGKMLYNEEYQYEIKNIQNGLEISDFISFKTFDKDNNEVTDVLKLTIENNVLKFIPIGLGDGTLEISVNGSIETFPISISLENEILTNDVTNGKLLSENDLKIVKSIYYTGEKLDIDDLIVFNNLEDIAFVNDEKICECYDILERYTYHVKEKVFLDYYNDSKWKEFQTKIEPYDTSIENDKFVIYHDEKTNILECKQVDKLFEFKLLSTIGYIHNKQWSISNKEESIQTIEDIINSEENCINLYAIWSPIKYKIEYHSTLTKTDQIVCSIECKYDEEFKLEKLTTHNNLGYTLVGWSRKTNETKTINIENSEELEEVEYNLINKDYLMLKNLTSIENDVIKVYDVWRPNKYTIIFERQNGCEKEMSSIINSIEMKYNDSYNLIKNNEKNEFFDIPGYKITKWVTETNEEFDSNNPILLNLTAVDNEIIKLTPVLEGKTYKVILKLPSDFDMNVGTLNQYKEYESKAKISYDTSLNELEWYDDKNQKTTINLNLQYLPTFEGYYWFIDLNDNSAKDEDEPTFNPVNGLTYNNDFSVKSFNYINIDSNSNENIIICPKGVSTQYYLNVNLNGGNLSNVELPNNSLYENENVNLTFNSPIKNGYQHRGWTVYLKDDSDNLKKKITIKSTTITINRSKVNDILLEDLKNLDKIEIIAEYDKLYTLIFKDEEEVITSITKIAGEKIPTISNLSKVGATFMGWDNDIPTTMPDYDLIINAIWNYTIYTITYNVNGGNLSGATNSYISSDNINLQEPTRTNHLFDGWFETSDFSGSRVTSITKGTTGNKVYYAKWLALTETWIASVENGKRDKRVNDDDGVFEIVQYNNIDIQRLLELGYKTVTLSVSLDVKELDDGYQQFWIYSGTTDTRIKEQEFEHGGSGKDTSWGTHYFSFIFDLNTLLNSNAQFKVQYGARGKDNDDWMLGYTNYTIKISK